MSIATVESSGKGSRLLPDLTELLKKEAHVSLLFDDHPAGKCLLAVGARRSFIWNHNDSDAVRALDHFLHPNGQACWAFGWMGYELKNGIENLQSKRINHSQLPSLHWVEPRIVVEWGGRNKGPIILSGHDEPDAAEILNIASTTTEHIPPAPGLKLKPRWDRSTYLQRAHRVKKHIQRGDIYEMNLCQEWGGFAELNAPWDVFVRLQHFTQAPYSGFIQAGDFHILCGSPELFLSREGNTLTSSPIKGTIRRGNTEDEDQALARQLKSDPKERGENVMICDLVRNDLSRVALPGTVHVPELFGIHRFRTVHQMISTVQCEIPTSCRPESIIRATFPMGSMTGAPKVRAMEIIDDLEGSQRGVYSGSLGAFRPNGNFDLNVVIRSIVYNASLKHLSLHVGGAITALSDPEKEYEECLLKADALLKTLHSDA